MKTEDAGSALPADRGPGWVRLQGRSRWEELVLPEDSRRLLRSISADLRVRVSKAASKRVEGRPQGLKLLFAGERGTGKKMASRILAAELDLAVFSIDLASVLSPDSVETEHRLERIFATAAGSNAILYLNDAEAWFGKRSHTSSDDGWAGMAVSQLLRRIEAYRGVVVFATALMSEIDDELVGRVDYLVDFPFPDEAARRSIWRLLLPADARVRDRDLDFLAGSFQLPGGAIRDCCAAAAAAATQAGVALDMRHVMRAVEQAYSGRIQGARTREAFERFHGGTWVPDEPVAAAPVAANSAPAVASPRARPLETRRHAARRDPRLAVLGLVVALAAAVGGFLIAHGSSPPPASVPALDRHATAGLLAVSFPSTWQQQAPPAHPRLGLRDELALAPKGSAGGVLVIGRIGTTDPTLLPHRILSALHSTPTAELVTLSGTQFDRYLNLSLRGVSGRETVYAVPSTVGTVLGVCLQGSAPSSFVSSCERIVGTIKLSSGSVLGIGPSASYASGLNAALTTLNADRSAPLSHLRSAKNPAAQAKAARALASVYTNAAAAVRGLPAGTATAANRAVGAALKSTGAAYAALARAAARNSASGYAAASKSLTLAQSALSVAFSQLAELGYAVG